MSRAVHLAAALLAALPGAVASAGEVNGHLVSRTQLTRARTDGLLSTRDVPQVQEVVELNAQVKQRYAERGFFAGDLSLFLQAAGNYRALDAGGDEVVVADHDAPGARPVVALNELYLSHDVVPELNLLLGKKRLVWGSGMAVNPTDLLNPPKDPTDPSLQRSGAWMARVELPFEQLAFSFVFSPQVTHEVSGLPARFLWYPAWSEGDDEPHFLFAARAYALVNDADLNVMLFYGNRYGDDFADKPRIGFSFSRYFFTDYELHVEALLQEGSARQYPNGACLGDQAAALRCVATGAPLLEQSRLHDAAITPAIVAGTRYQFPDETLISLEYLYQADGYTPQELQLFVNALALQKEAQRLGLGMPALPSASSGSLSSRFSFEPLGQHHLFLTAQKPKIRDDWTVSVVLIASAQDLSGMVSPSIAWSATQWLTVTLSGFFPFPGPGALAATVPETDDQVSEYTLLPLRYRAALELRAFY